MTHTKDKALKPCRSPYCECSVGECSHPGCYDAQHEEFTPPGQPAPVQELTNIQRHEQNVQKFLAAQPAPDCKETGICVASGLACFGQPAPVQPEQQEGVWLCRSTKRTETGMHQAWQVCSWTEANHFEKKPNYEYKKFYAPPAQPPVQEPVALEMDGKQLTLGEALEEAIAATERSASKRLNTVLVAAKNALYTTPPAQPAPVQPAAWESKMRSELARLGFEGQCPESIGITIKSWFDAYAESLTAQPEQEPVAWLVEEYGDSILVRHSKNFPGIFAGDEFRKRPLVYGDTTPPAQPAVPDAIVEAGESPDYRDGWNDCRQAMLKGMK